ncbi:MAG: DUF6514 family protein [Firmicutes bacterium]|nr:DUF6514 family protein [Bacillota bacterium]
MEKEFFGEAKVKVEDDVAYEMRLAYYITVTSVSEEYCDLKFYGVEIDKEACYADGSKETEKKMLDDLFFNKNECRMFVQKLLDNEVTPIGLKYVVREYIGEKIHI